MRKTLKINVRPKDSATEDEVIEAITKLGGYIVNKTDSAKIFQIEPPVKTPNFLKDLKKTELFDLVERTRFYKNC